MMRLLTKICGLTRPEDALLAADCGAHLLGYIVAPSSKRRALPEAIAQCIRMVRPNHPGILHVLVTLDQPVSDILNLARDLEVDAIQLHGNEPAEVATTIRDAGYLVIKAVAVGPGAPSHDWLGYPCDYRLADTYHDGASGGTGKLLDTRLIPPPDRRSPQPLLLAGGLNTENLMEVLARFQPDGVDVSSGVESAPGIKDPEKIRAFLRAARQA
jgi:phosphoribosylanthranilate isomerase